MLRGTRTVRTGTHDDDAVQRKERRQRRESATGCELPTRNGTFCPRRQFRRSNPSNKATVSTAKCRPPVAEAGKRGDVTDKFVLVPTGQLSRLLYRVRG